MHPSPAVEALILRGVMAGQAAQFEDAVRFFDRALDIDPASAEAHGKRGLALQSLGQREAALACYERALAIEPNHPEVYFNRGNLLAEGNQLEAAIGDYESALRHRPQYAEAYCNRGIVLSHLHQWQAALDSFDRAIALRPEFAEAHCNKSFTLLLQGEFRLAWPLYEWRWKMDEGTGGANRLAPLAKPLWLGRESVAGKTVLLRGEQGIGDILQFCRYVKPVADLGACVVLEVPRPLVSLLIDLPGVSQLVVKGSALPPFDLHCPLMSLPLAFATAIDSIPTPTAYLCSDPAKVTAWRSRLGAPQAPRIGLVWSGNPANKNDRNRSLALAELLAHLPLEFQYVSLQKEVRDSDADTLRGRPKILAFAEELHDFSDTAALCECMDAIVCVDTSVAHLCGALGKRTHLLLPFNANWRWLLDRNDSPWYSSVSLYRQGLPADWAPVLRRVAGDLANSFARAGG